MVGGRRMPRWRASPRQHCGSSARFQGRRSFSNGSDARRGQYMKETPVLRAVDLTKVYHRGSEEVRALNGVTFEVGAGEFVAVTGPSGAGKTTLLSIVGGMDTPT